MNYKSFEDLPVWQASIEFALKVFEFTEKAEKELRGLGDTKNQLERAAISISNNIAEGFERGTNAELINFLYIARGSSGECRSMLCLCERLPRFANLKPGVFYLKSRAKNISSQLYGWIESLKNSSEKGEKFYTEKDKAQKRKREELLEFRKELDEITNRNKKRFQAQSE